MNLLKAEWSDDESDDDVGGGSKGVTRPQSGSKAAEEVSLRREGSKGELGMKDLGG